MFTLGKQNAITLIGAQLSGTSSGKSGNAGSGFAAYLQQISSFLGSNAGREVSGAQLVLPQSFNQFVSQIAETSLQINGNPVQENAQNLPVGRLASLNNLEQTTPVPPVSLKLVSSDGRVRLFKVTTFAVARPNQTDGFAGLQPQPTGEAATTGEGNVSLNALLSDNTLLNSVYPQGMAGKNGGNSQELPNAHSSNLNKNTVSNKKYEASSHTLKPGEENIPNGFSKVAGEPGVVGINPEAEPAMWLQVPVEDGRVVWLGLQPENGAGQQAAPMLAFAGNQLSLAQQGVPGLQVSQTGFSGPFAGENGWNITSGLNTSSGGAQVNPQPLTSTGKGQSSPNLTTGNIPQNRAENGKGVLLGAGWEAVNESEFSAGEISQLLKKGDVNGQVKIPVGATVDQSGLWQAAAPQPQTSGMNTVAGSGATSVTGQNIVQNEVPAATGNTVKYTPMQSGNIHTSGQVTPLESQATTPQSFVKNQVFSQPKVSVNSFSAQPQAGPANAAPTVSLTENQAAGQSSLTQGQPVEAPSKTVQSNNNQINGMTGSPDLPAGTTAVKSNGAVTRSSAGNNFGYSNVAANWGKSGEMTVQTENPSPEQPGQTKAETTLPTYRTENSSLAGSMQTARSPISLKTAGRQPETTGQNGTVKQAVRENQTNIDAGKNAASKTLEIPTSNNNSAPKISNNESASAGLQETTSHGQPAVSEAMTRNLDAALKNPSGILNYDPEGAPIPEKNSSPSQNMAAPNFNKGVEASGKETANLTKSTGPNPDSLRQIAKSVSSSFKETPNVAGSGQKEENPVQPNVKEEILVEHKKTSAEKPLISEPRPQHGRVTVGEMRASSNFTQPQMIATPPMEKTSAGNYTEAQPKLALFVRENGEWKPVDIRTRIENSADKNGNPQEDTVLKYTDKNASPIRLLAGLEGKRAMVQFQPKISHASNSENSLAENGKTDALAGKQVVNQLVGDGRVPQANHRQAIQPEPRPHSGMADSADDASVLSASGEKISPVADTSSANSHSGWEQVSSEKGVEGGLFKERAAHHSAMGNRPVSASAATTAVYTSLEEPMQMVKELARQMQGMLLRNGREMVLQLRPENLGLIRVRLRGDKEKMHARIETSAPEVQQLLQKHQTELIHRLAEQEISLENLEFSLLNSFKENKNGQSGLKGGNHSGHHLVSEEVETPENSPEMLQNPLKYGHSTFEYIA
ncbi:MAG: hypothetical protein Kow0037_19920 [Calditrichia bacterium]